MDTFFNLFKPETENENYYLVAANENIHHKAYSERSLNRETQALTNLIQNCIKTNKTLIWISPFHGKILFELDKDLIKNLIWISPVNFTSSQKTIIDNADKLNYFLREIGRSDSFSIEAHVCFKNMGVEKSFQHLMMRLLKNSAVRLKTIAHFSKLWENNFKRNYKKWILLPDLMLLKATPPDIFILGGPSVDNYVSRLKPNMNIWCADTALPTLLFYNIIPTCVFSLDAGHGSYEHFITAIYQNKTSQMTLLIDPLSFPALFGLTFHKKFTYANSNPFIQQSKNNFTIIENLTDDVFGFMQAVYQLVFKDFNIKTQPEIIGHDGGHIRKVTHLKGSAYHRRQYMRNNRLATPELYFYRLSFRYSRN